MRRNRNKLLSFFCVLLENIITIEFSPNFRSTKDFVPPLPFFDLLAMPALDLKGCVEDSPVFRRRIAAHEESISNFDTSLKCLAKLVRSQVDLSAGTVTWN